MRIAGKGEEGSAMDVAGELIEHDYQRQRAIRRHRPTVQSPVESGAMGEAETLADRGVKIQISREPARTPELVRVTREPEIQHIPCNHSARSNTRTECTASRPVRSRI
jgi:hypothetical protein